MRRTPRSPEPAGIALAGPDRLLLADSNNRGIQAYDLAGRTVRIWPTELDQGAKCLRLIQIRD